MSKQESPQEIVKQLLYEKGLAGMREIFELPASFSAPMLFAWKRLSLGNLADGSAVRTVEPIMKDYAQMTVDCVHNLDEGQIAEGVKILIDNFFIKNKDLHSIRTVDDYYQFIEKMNNSGVEQGKDSVGDYVEKRIDELETRFGVFAQHFFLQVKDGVLDTDLTIWEFLENQAKPLKKEIDLYLDW
jgi:hypothetical protein